MLQLLFLELFPEQREVIDRVNSQITKMMKETTERNGMDLLYIPLPTKLQIEPDSDPIVLQRTLEVCGFDRSVLKIEDGLYESFISLLDEQGINHVDVRPMLRKRANEGVLYDRTYHPTALAHRIIAKSLFETIAPKLMQRNVM